MQTAHQAAASLRSARLEFSRGQLDAARRVCRGILEDFPHQAGALHLLGVIAHQLGDQAQAGDLLRQAAESPETTAVYLLTYAELFCKARDTSAAVQVARRAVALDEGLPLGWCYLGSLLLESRKLPESRECFERALALDDNFWQARTNLAIVQGHQGETAAAMAQFERLLREQPDNAEVLGSFAALLRDQGRYGDALAQAERAITKQPGALDHPLRAAEIEILLGRHGAAMARLDVLDKECSSDLKWLTLKAHLLRLLDHYDEAVALCRDALSRGIESADLLRAYGLALHLAGEHVEALQVFDRAVVADQGAALSDKGVLLSQLGRLTEACEAFDQALSRDPTSADAWYNKANAKTYAPADPELLAMRQAIDSSSIYRNRLLLHFALGKAHMDAGDTAQAFSHWHEGNRMKRAIVDYDADAMKRYMTSIAVDSRQNGTANRATGARISEAPVFIVGMPRCGSSLVEQILASHPDVHGAGELAQLRVLFEACAHETCAHETGGHEDALAARALDRLRRFSPDADRIVDKDLSNFLHLGMVHRTFPRARIIHCRRDPLDTCFSAYTKLFVGDYGFTYDMRELGLYYRHYHELMAHWRALLPPRIFMEIDYETLVSEPREETRRLLDFLELPWNDACVRFFETARLVNTASFAQVRRPVYRSSVGCSRPLRSYLQPLIAALGDLAPA
jgi:tetratricopeptide (TPR) repeat protein